MKATRGMRFTRFLSLYFCFKPVENSLLDSRGIVSQLEAVVAAAAAAVKQNAQQIQSTVKSIPQSTPNTQEGEAEQEAEGEDGQGEGDDSEDKDDIEIIMEPQSRSLDFRQQRPQQRTPSATVPFRITQPSHPSLTTEYTPIQRLDSTSTITASSSLLPPSIQPTQSTASQPTQSTASQPSASQATTSTNNLNISLDNGVDPATLPPVKAPPSHPGINPTAPGMLDGRAIFEVDISAMAEKPWRRAGSDISDWFNYEFDELSWEAYCYRRRELGEMADTLKVNVLNNLPLYLALPSDIRQMVMTGATAAMMNNTPNPGIMAPGVMMDVGMMNSMNMGMNQQMMSVDQRGMMMQDGVRPQGPMGNAVPLEQGGGGGMPVGMMQDGFIPAGPMAMGMPGDHSTQDQSQMFPGAGMDTPGPQNMQAVPT
ncbi:Fip1 motif-domain-containing protein, partial [Lentinula raphanica]